MHWLIWQLPPTPESIFPVHLLMGEKQAERREKGNVLLVG